jgi:hypothetical protein
MRSIHMTKQTLRFSLGVVSVILMALLTMLVKHTLNVGEVKAQSSCTLETIKGTYLFQGNGVVVNEGEVRPYTEAGTWTLDGNGNAAGLISSSIDGVSSATRQAFTATYELSSECVYTVVDQFGFKVDLYTTPTGTPMAYFSEGFSGTQFRQ